VVVFGVGGTIARPDNSGGGTVPVASLVALIFPLVFVNWL
jgi:hypothetical protein